MKLNRDDELEREIRDHLELEIEDRVADGLSEDEAVHAARRAFGNVTRVREEVRAVWTWRWLEDIRRDLRYAIRSLGRQPTFTTYRRWCLASIQKRKSFRW